MKKNILIFTFLSLLGSLSCSKKSSTITPAECSSTISNEYTAAVNAWVADIENTTKCKAVFTILGKLVNCPGVPAATKAEYQKELNNNPCK